MAVKTVQAIINGVTTILTLNSCTGKYEATDHSSIISPVIPSMTGIIIR